MKKVLLASMFLLLQLAAHAQTRYKVSLSSDPEGTLYAYAHDINNLWNSNTEFEAGMTVELVGSLRAEYSFVNWTDERGTVVCDSLRYVFTMPAHDVTLVGHTEYDPENPPGPHEDGYTDTWNRLYLRSLPEYGGSFTWGPGAERAQNWLVWTGYEFTVTAYPATGFKFVGFQLDGEIVSTDNPYTFIMPERDMTLYAVYDYDPDAPPHPDGNKWDKESGQLIMTDFTPGNLADQITEVTRRDPWSSDWELIKSATVAGPCLQDGDGWATHCDWQAFDYATNMQFLDYSRTSGLTAVPAYCFSDKEQLASIVLPATTDSIGPLAFRQCSALASVTCFATTPPVFGGSAPSHLPQLGEASGTLPLQSEGGWGEAGEAWAFDGLNTDDIIVHVPAEAVPLYQEARGWKVFMILPITQGVQRLTVHLPQAADYKDMFLELVDMRTAQRLRYVITGNTSYTFNNLIRDTQHSLFLKNQRGEVLGRIERIDIVDQDVEVSFTDLKTPIDVTLRFVTPDGATVGEDDYTVTWTDRQGSYLGTGATLAGQLSGSQVRYRVRLEEKLGRQYRQPADSMITVGAPSHLPRLGEAVLLQPLSQAALSGTVTAASTGKPVRAATVTVNQMLNGLYATSQMVKTDGEGHWSVTAYEAPTTITVTHSDYLKASLEASPEQGRWEGSFALRDITGTIVDLDLYYRASVHEGEESTSEEYDGYENIGYTIYDETHQRDLSDVMSVQYPMIVLVDEELEPGTRLTVTATSTDKRFMPVTATCSVDGTGRATATLPIVQLGQVEASFEMTDNESVVALLFDGEGQLTGWAPYRGVSLTLSDIADGRYRLITMGNSMLSTSLNTLHALNNIGLKEGDDYVQNEIEVRSGHIVEVSNTFIPAFDETAFLYTGDGTAFTANRQEVTVGQYVTLKAQVDFKPAFEAEHVQLLFDLPEGCTLVEGSVMVGNHTASYENGYRLKVDIEGSPERASAQSSEASPQGGRWEGGPVRFCVVPTTSGIMQVTATVSADLNGQNTRQPIGAAVFSAEDLTINVPVTTGRRLLPVTGMAVPLSTVEVYDGDVLIGQTTSTGNGYWNTLCELDHPFNLSEHTVYAVVTMPEGIQMRSETKTVKVNRGSLTPVVTLQLKGTDFEHHQRDFVFDYRTGDVNPSGMKLTDFGHFNLDVRVDFYDQNDLLVNDTTAVHDVTLYALLEHGETVSWPLRFNERYQCWYLQPDLTAANMPINFDVDYTLQPDVAFDREELEYEIAELMNYFEEGRQHTLEIFHMTDEAANDAETLAALDELGQLWQSENPDAADRQRIQQLTTSLVGDSIMASVQQKYRFDDAEIDALTAREWLSEEELARLDDLINQRVSHIEALSAETTDITLVLQQLEQFRQELTATAEEMRDSMLLLSSFIYYPDTVAVTLPSGDAQMVIPVSQGRYQQIDIQSLGSIDADQLLAEGYEAIPVTDGSFFYYLQHDGGYTLIDGKELKSYSLRYVNEAEVNPARAVDWRWFEFLLGYSASFFFPQGCFGQFDTMGVQFTKFVEQMKQSTDLNSFFTNLTTNLIPLLQSSQTLLECLYNDGSSKFRNFVQHRLEVMHQALQEKWNSASRFCNNFKNQIAELSQQLEQATKNKELLNIQKKYYQAEKATAEAAGDVANIAKWENAIRTAEGKLAALERTITSFTQRIENLTAGFKEAEKLFKKADDAFKIFKKGQTWFMAFVNKLPVAIGMTKTMQFTQQAIKWVFAVPVIGPILKCIPCFVVCADNIKDSGEWVKLFRAVEDAAPCEGDMFAWSDLFADTQSKMKWHLGVNLGHCAIDITSLASDAIAGLTPGWLIGRVLDVLSCVIAVFHPEASQKDRDMLWNRYYALKCVKDKEEKPTDTNDPNGDWMVSGGTLIGAKMRYDHPTWTFPRLWFARDPSGYVYEAVNSNRVEGVTATCYYKEEVEDMFGDIHERVVLWDAENYEQENPLFTDADGRYQWDVPTGWWQVKYEKQGYETTCSDWLPVPPPQLEVNVGITQLRQPQVQQVRAYAATEGSTTPSGVEVLFDKYMDPATLTTDNISVVAGGQALRGKIVLLNAEDGYQKPGVQYASKIRFEPESPLEGSKVLLTVSRRVESYAGIPMQQDFTQEFDVELRIDTLIADTVVNIPEGQERKLYVKAMPAKAAQGRKVTVVSLSPDIVNLQEETLILDQNGEAELTVSALGPGSSAVRFTLAETPDLSAATLITVRDSASMQVKAPRSSRLNGITMYQGSEIRLTCATPDARILYTLDGSCPCAPESGKVMTYNGPIILTGDSILIKAMAIANGMEDSPVVEFRYKGIQRPVDIAAPTADDCDPTTMPKLYFRLDGRRITRPERGLNIERRENGQARIVVVK